MSQGFPAHKNSKQTDWAYAIFPRAVMIRLRRPTSLKACNVQLNCKARSLGGPMNRTALIFFQRTPLQHSAFVRLCQLRAVMASPCRMAHRAISNGFSVRLKV